MPQSPQIDWTQQPLGETTDRELAARLGVSKWVVFAARKRLGVGPRVPSKTIKGISWDTVALGQRPDTCLAKEMGVQPSVVCNARNRRGIPPFKARSSGVVWEGLPLGEYPDSAIARWVGVSQITVTRHRNKLGILPFRATFLTPEGEGGNYPEAMIDLYWHHHNIPHQFQVSIGPYRADWVIHGTTVVEYAGFSASPRWGAAYEVRLEKKKSFYEAEGWGVWVIYPSELKSFELKEKPEPCRDLVSGKINWSQQPLGQISDSKLAKKLKINQPSVSRWRNLLGIPPYQHPQRDWSRVPLGQVYDRVLAQKLGVSKNTIRRARVARNIPSYREASRVSEKG